MELEIGPGANVQPGSFCVMISPEEFLASSLNSHLDLQRFQVLYVCGNRSGILDRLHRRFANIDVRRAFTAFQLLTVLEEVASHADPGRTRPAPLRGLGRNG